MIELDPVHNQNKAPRKGTTLETGPRNRQGVPARSKQATSGTGIAGKVPRETGKRDDALRPMPRVGR
jgi:hypothetical protein